MQNCKKELIVNISFRVNAHARVVLNQSFFIYISLAVLNENLSIFLFIFGLGDSARTRTKGKGGV